MTESADLIAGRYRLAAQIGVGGMGVVWRARDEVLGRTVALKELTVPSAIGREGRDDEGARRALREARLAARLHHPNVIGIYDIVDHDGRPFLVMEYLASRSLSQLIADGELLPPQRAARIGALLAGALDAAHDVGIVHRDVKPGNVLLGNDGSVKLTDFGISRAADDTTVTASGILLGTLGYIAPETAQGDHADARADVYALGATLYAAVEGHAPFGEDDNAVALMYRIVHEEIIPAQHAGPLEPVLLWMLERDPARRPTMPQARQALEAVENASQQAPAEPAKTVPVPAPVQAAAPPPPASLPPPPSAPAGTDDDNVAREQPERRRLTRRALIGVLIVAALLALGGWALAALTTNSPTSPTAASSKTATASASHNRVPSSSPSSSPSTSAHPGTATPPSVSPTSPTSATSPPSQGVAAQLVATIVDYYKLVPNNLDRGWTWMTADYQTNHAGGRNGYQSFWSQVASVTASDVTANPPDSVTATIDYHYKNGTTVEERTEFTLVFEQGRWLIAASSVLSSRSG